MSIRIIPRLQLGGSGDRGAKGDKIEDNSSHLLGSTSLESSMFNDVELNPQSGHKVNLALIETAWYNKC